MIKRIKFEKEGFDWFAVIPEWQGPKADLQMVCGADTWLDLLCQGEWHVWLTISNEPFEGASELKLIALGEYDNVEVGSGASYKLSTKLMGIDYDLEMWLCDVTKFVFGDFPKIIYFK